MTAFLALLAAAASTTPATDTETPPATEAQRTAASPQDGEIVVTGVQTIGSDDYTIDGQTTATRLPLSLRETPQSVSVVTRAQIEDFQLNDINALLTTVPGINVQFSDTDRV